MGIWGWYVLQSDLFLLCTFSVYNRYRTVRCRLASGAGRSLEQLSLDIVAVFTARPRAHCWNLQHLPNATTGVNSACSLYYTIIMHFSVSYIQYKNLGYAKGILESSCPTVMARSKRHRAWAGNQKLQGGGATSCCSVNKINYKK